MASPIDPAAAYRPDVRTSVAFSGVWIATAALLAWLGVILGPEDREAMDGLSLLLFTVVPIRLFCWVMAAVFVGLAGVILRRGFGGPPSLRLSPEGLTLRSGRRIPWGDVRSTEVTSQGVLVIEFREGPKVSLSSLGACPSNTAGRVGSATAPGRRRTSEGIAIATSRRSNDRNGAVPPQPTTT